MKYCRVCTSSQPMLSNQVTHNLERFILGCKVLGFILFFYNCIDVIDGTHVPIVVPVSKVVQHTGRHGYTTQNVLAICDFDMRFTFVLAG